VGIAQTYTRKWCRQTYD